MELRHRLTRGEGFNYPSPEHVGHFPKGFVSIVASKPGTGKTWYTLYNLYTFSKAGFRMGAIVGDAGPSLVYDRVRLIANDCDNENIFCYFISDFEMNDLHLNLSDTKGDGIRQLERLLTGQQLDVLFLDTLVSLMQADESSLVDMAFVMRELKGLAQRTNSAIVINHHLRKGMSDEKKKQEISIDEVIGSSVLTRLAGLVLLMQKDGAAIRITPAKTWFSDQKKSLFRVTNFKDQVVLEEVGLAETLDLASRPGKQQACRAFVEGLPKDTTFTASDILTSTNHKLSATLLREVVKAFIASGQVVDMTPNDNFFDKLFRKNT